MIDHLIKFETVIDLSVLQITLPEFVTFGNNATGAMVGNMPVNLLRVSIINDPAVYDPETTDLITPAVIADGDWLVVRSDDEIDWRFDPRLVTVTDDEIAMAEEAFIIWKNPDVPIEAMQGRVSPTFAGSKYPFGPDVNESKLIS